MNTISIQTKHAQRNFQKRGEIWLEKTVFIYLF